MTPTHRTSPTLEVVDLRIVNRLEAGPTWTLTGVSFRVYPQEVVALTGPPNPGLSALLSCLAGIVEADGGTVRVGGEVLSRRSTVERSLIRTATIGTVGRIDELVDDLTVLQNAEQSQRIAGVADPVLVALLISELGLTECVDAVPDMLTRSETVRAAVLVALAKRPQLLLADDPTAEADTSTSMMIARLLRRTSSTGVAGVLVTRDPALLAIADREISVAVSRTGP
ncbi:MAG TPA: ATP-binding cassette domain-containing protein [Ilumatobacteraceae bacterium]|nr:ATP-binding cassette domain-containing protein [Ilumatobacteraceae bacterium]